MAESTDSAKGVPGITWQVHEGERVVIHCAERSSASAAAGAYVRHADAILAAVEATVAASKGSGTEPVDLYLVDPLPDLSDDGAQDPSASTGVGATAAFVAVEGDGAAGDLAAPLTRLLLTRKFGPDVGAADVFIEGIAGLAAGQAGVGPTAEEADMIVRGELESGRQVSALGGVAPPGPDDGEEAPPEPPLDTPPEDPGGGAVVVSALGGGGGGGFGPALPPEVVAAAAATSFVGYLVKSHEPGSLARFLETYRADRRDEAAVAVYNQPLTALEQKWLSSLNASEGPSLFSSIKFLTPLLRPHLWSYAEAFGYMLIGVIFTIAVPVVSGCMIDALTRVKAPAGLPKPGGLCGAVAPSLTTGRVVTIVLVLLVAYLVQTALSLRRTYIEARIYSEIGVTLRERMFTHLQRLSHRFYGAARVGDLTTRLSDDLDILQASMNQIFGGGVALILTSVLASATALSKNVYVGGLVLLLIPAFILTQKIIGPRMAITSVEAQEMAGDAAAVLQENLSAHAVIKAFGLEQRAVASYRGSLNAAVRKRLRLLVLGQVYEGTINFAATLAQLIVLGLGSVLVIRGTIGNPGTMVALLLLLPSIIGPVAQLGDLGQIIQMGAGSIQRTRDVLDAPLDIVEKPDAIELPPLERDIRFEQVMFSYEKGQPILKGVNFAIPKGTNVAFVGPSGSGKSTIVNLLLRFWDPDEGSVLIDGHDLRDVTLASLRQEIGIVFQDTFVFNSTLRDNISIGRPDASDAEVEAAARAAQLDSFIESQPAGLDTVLGERGSRMSGGQRQRLAIARAILRDPRILILDEATSALDARTEAEVLDTLASLVKGRTTISITHRLALAAMADTIFVLEEGRLIERGPHDELVKSGGLYQQLYDEQMGISTPAGRPRGGLEAQRLHTVPLFTDVPAKTLADLAEQLVLERYKEGEDIVRQGDPAEKLYVLGLGSADVFVSDGVSERRVNTLQEGDYFGEFALLTQSPRTATVRAAGPTEVYALSRERFLALVEREPSLRAILDQFVAERRAQFAAAAEAAGVSA